MSSIRDWADMPKLQDYISGGNDSAFATDLDALTYALPAIVLARMDASEEDAPRLEAAVEAVAYTIANLNDIRKEIFE